jgi:hypothetical protein
MRAWRFLLEVFLVGWLVVVVGCAENEGMSPDSRSNGGTAGSSTTGEGGTGGDLLPSSSSSGGGGGGPICDGECHLWKSAAFDDLSMFWIGSGAPPACPGHAPVAGVTLHADPQPSPYVCSECSCAPAGCALPEEMHVSAAKCPGIGAPSIAWDSPAWDGSCTAEGAIPPGLLCAGVPCTQSITIAAPKAEPCTVVSEGADVPTDPVWGLTAQECILGPLSGEGCGGSEACVEAPPEGFSLCLYRWGDLVAPEHCPAEYPRYLVVYAEHEDTRGCEPCGCSDPQGAECSALVSVFTDGACGALLGSFPVSTVLEEACFDLSPGIGLGSKAGALSVNKPGSCTASGGPVGTVVPTVPVTLCCQPAPNEVPR